MGGIKYSGENLRQIKFLLGGIGAGNISLEGRGSLTDWEIFNRPHKGNKLFANFVSLHFNLKGKDYVKIIDRKPFPPFEGSHGFENIRMEGYPHFSEAEFTDFFPFAIIDFFERNFPLKISLTAYTPFIPLDFENSSLPIAIFKYKFKNITGRKIDFKISFSMMNPVGTDGTEKLNSPLNKCFGKNINEYFEKENLKGIYFYSRKYNKEDIRYGNITLATDSQKVFYKLKWEEGEWWKNWRVFWEEFFEGNFKNKDIEETPDGKTSVASLGIKETIYPDEEKEINFYLSWYFPNRINYWGLDKECKGKILKNWYSKKFSNSKEVIEYFIKNEKYLFEKSKNFSERFFSSSLPEDFISGVSSQFHTLRSNTFFITDDGNFYGFEGCSENSGCCPLNCTHVLNYEQLIAFFFPEFEKRMRKVDYLYNTDENGYMAFRTNIPLGIKRWKSLPAADGQCGTILKVYREWKISGDKEFLKEIYNSVKKSMEFVWKEWDKDKDGLMEGRQHTTYDIELYGPNPFTSFIYLASLKAMMEISEFMGDMEFSERCKEIFEKGRKNIMNLWNGKYFIQKCNISPTPPYQFCEGCLSSQLLGQFLSDILNLGNLIEEKYINKTLSSILKFNFLDDFSKHKNYMRIYAINEEKGLVLCSWPYGN
ncbi:hypothetical protein J7L87_05990, partial [bacterium]|nr:hypothetical protein [bacterium]